MARRRFFADAWEGNTALLSGRGAEHLARVLRATPGQEYELAWEGAVYLGRIERVERQQVRFAVLERLLDPVPLAPCEMGVAIFKFDRFEWMLEKACELGVTTIWPLLSRRSDAHLRAAAPARLARWRQIVRQAAEQSRRAEAPEVAEPRPLSALLTESGPEHRWHLAEDGHGRPLGVLAQAGAGAACRILVGPEGGWSPEESLQAQAAGYTAATLGPRILRCETAVLAALAIVGAATNSAPCEPGIA